ncbi:MAG: hypothetical protein NZL96_02125 [Patescibacteria group bacterium]|nr:hypothetical protein [Patescibacteria group bacterium]
MKKKRQALLTRGIDKSRIILSINLAQEKSLIHDYKRKYYLKRF